MSGVHSESYRGPNPCAYVGSKCMQRILTLTPLGLGTRGTLLDVPR